MQQKSSEESETIDGNKIINELFKYTFIDMYGNEHEFLCSNNDNGLLGFDNEVRAVKDLLLRGGNFYKKGTTLPYYKELPYLGYLYIYRRTEKLYIVATNFI